MSKGKASRKPEGGGGGREPTGARGLTPRRPGPGSARGRGSPRHRAVPGVDPHCPRAGRDSLLSRVLMCFAKGLWRFCPLARRHNWNCHVLSSRAAAHPVQGVWSYESMSIWRTSSATLVTCVKYAIVCVSPGGRRPGGGTSHSHAWPGYDGTTFIVSPREFPTPSRPRGLPRSPHLTCACA